MQIKEDSNKFKHYYPPKVVMDINAAFHPKLFIIKFERFLRVVVGSANMFEEDWNIWNNILWMKDFYLKSNNEQSEDTNFKGYLENYLKSIMLNNYEQMDKFLQINLENYNFTETKVYLIGSLPQSVEISKIENKNKHGLLLVRQICQNNPPNKPFTLSNTTIYYSCSTLGSINFNFIYDFIISFLPSLAVTNFKKMDKDAFINILRVIYPTEDYVNLSLNGMNKTPLVFKKEFFDNIRFDKRILYKYEGKGECDGDNGVVSHIKLLVIMKNNKIDDDTIVYLGSHNFTKAAWGKFTKGFKFYTSNNYELGILMPPLKNSQADKQKILDNISFKIPAEKYDENDYPFLV